MIRQWSLFIFYKKFQLPPANNRPASQKIAAVGRSSPVPFDIVLSVVES